MWTWFIFGSFIGIVIWILSCVFVTYLAYITNRRWVLFLILCILLSPYVTLLILLIMLAAGTGEIEYRKKTEVSAYDNKKEEDFVPLHLKVLQKNQGKKSYFQIFLHFQKDFIEKEKRIKCLLYLFFD